MESKSLNSEELAELIVDVLIDAKYVKREDFDMAVEVVTEEITYRKAIGDYY